MNLRAAIYTGLSAGACVILLVCYVHPIAAAVFFSVFVGFLLKHTLAPSE